MIHPHTELRFISEAIGYGVVATKFIPRGTITWALDKLDRIFTPPDVQKLDPLYQEVLDKYTYRNAEGNYVLCWDNARFVNHSFRSNCLTTAYEFEIAIRDIHPGEELTDDYGYLNIDEPFEVLPEEGVDRKVVYPDDILRNYAIWDDQLADAFPDLARVDQPLFNILSQELRVKAMAISENREKLHSILHCYYPRHNGRINGEAKMITTRSPRILYPF
jgi:hypothetical protein